MPNCNDLATNPYSAVTRLIRGNFAGKKAEKCPGRIEKQISIRWDRLATDGIRELNEEEGRAEFPTPKMPPNQRTFGVFVMHHIHDVCDIPTLLFPFVSIISGVA